MADGTLDDAFARHVRQAGMATEDQVAAARRLATGDALSLGEALVRQGVITPLQRETVEKKLEERREHQNELGGYKILKKLGEGGMGAVYLAEQGPGGRRVAVKVLPKESAQDPEFIKRFRREAEAATRLEHPNIVRAFSAGEDKGYHFIVMEHCEGQSLRKRIDQDGFLPVATATSIVLEIAKGLAFAHAAGFIHRDIKPENVMITPTGGVKILDLGLAKNLADTQDSLRTVTGAALGTPHYISPEQARGDKSIDGRTDIYSLGATFYHAMTGKTPFSGSSIFEVIQKHLMEQLPDPRDLRPEIPAQAVEVLRRMMAKGPSDRYATAAALVADLELLERGQTPTAPALDPALSSIARPLISRALAGDPRRDRKLLYAGLAACAVLTILALTWPPSETPAKAEPPADRKPQEPAAQAKVSDPPGARGIDLLPLMDPKFGANGAWTRTADGIVSPDSGINAGPSRIWIPYSPPAEYEAALTVERVKGTEDLILAFVHKGRLAAIVLDGWWQEGACGAFLDGSWKRYPGARRRVLPEGKPARIGLSVRAAAVSVSVDGQPLMTFPEPDRLGMPEILKIDRDQADGFVVGTVRSSIKVTSFTLLPVAGEGRVLRQKP